MTEYSITEVNKLIEELKAVEQPSGDDRFNVVYQKGVSNVMRKADNIVLNSFIKIMGFVAAKNRHKEINYNTAAHFGAEAKRVLEERNVS